MLENIILKQFSTQQNLLQFPLSNLMSICLKQRKIPHDCICTTKEHEAGWQISLKVKQEVAKIKFQHPHWGGKYLEIFLRRVFCQVSHRNIALQYTMLSKNGTAEAITLMWVAAGDQKQIKCQLTFLYVRQLQNLMTYFRAACDQMSTSETHGDCVGKNRGSANPRITGAGKFTD